MTSVPASLVAALGNASPQAPWISSARGSWTGRQILDGADRLASWLRAGGPVQVPLVARFSDVAGSLVATLAGDLAGVPVIHVDPASRAVPPGRHAAGTPLRAPGAHADDSVGVYAAPADVEVGSSGIPAHSHTFLTSGSTGRPVAVVRGTAAVLADAERVAAFLRYRPDTPVLVGVPLCHAYGFNYGLVAALLAGAPVHYCGPRVLPSQLARAVREHGAVTLIGHPVLFRLIAQEAVRQQGPVLPGLTQAVSAGAPLPPGAASAIAQHDRFTLLSCYGSSEAGAVTLAAVDGTEPPGTAGSLLPGVVARTEDGELLLRSTSLASGYRTDAGFGPLPTTDGWYRTGDLAVLAGDVVRLHGRVAGIINVAGKKVSPDEIEQILSAHPAVADVAVHGEADDARGQVPVALVVLRDGIGNRELLGWCQARLAPHMVPRRFEVRDELPRSPTGKRLRPDGAGPAR